MPNSAPIIVYAQACDLCRKMKIKCERKGDECTHCVASNAECTFAPVERKPPKVKRPELLESMEQRIERMEAILGAADLSKESRATSPDEADDRELTDMFSSLAVNQEGEAKFIGRAHCRSYHPDQGLTLQLGSSSPLSLFSPKGLEWTSQHASLKELNLINVDAFQQCHDLGPQIGSDWFQQLPEHDRELPKKKVAVKYVKCECPLLLILKRTDWG